MSTFAALMRNRNKLIIPFAVSVMVVFISYHVFWPPILMDDIPHPSCTEMGSENYSLRSDNYASKEILFGIAVTNRVGYTNFTASVLRKYHGIPGVDIYIYSDHRKTYDERTLRSLYGNDIKILPRPQSRTRNVLNIFTESNYKILFLVDSEIIFLPNWRDFLTKQMFTHNRHFLSLYHSATLHSFEKDCEILQGEVCEGKISNDGSVALSKDFAKKILPRYPELIDRNEWNEILKKENLPGFYPANSLSIRIGQMNQDDNYCGVNDVPYGFRLCELPCWIRDGIELYFDLCTNPQERYTPNLSLMQASVLKRMWTRPAVVYSFYGNKPRYVVGALENAKRVYKIYPGWKIWVFNDNTLSLDVVKKLCSLNVKFVNMTGTNIKNQMSWRFLIAAEPVKYFTILDIDYRMLARGREATEDWLKSGRTIHVMRDHPNHSKIPLNPMWGGYGSSIPNMKQLIAEYRGNNNYMVDINFLTAKVWPIVKQSVWVHDAYSLHIYGEDHPFPTERRGEEFVGSVDYSEEASESDGQL